MFPWQEILLFFKHDFHKDVVLSWPIRPAELIVDNLSLTVLFVVFFFAFVVLSVVVTQSTEAQTALMTIPDGASPLI